MKKKRTAICLFLGAVALLEGAPVREVIRDIHAVWNEDGTYLLVAESRYRTTKPEEPYFNAPSAKDWEIRLYEIGPLRGPVAPGALTGLSPQRVPLGGWKEDAEPGGTLMGAPLYWQRVAGRLVGIENQDAFLFDIRRGRRTVLRPPEKESVELVGPELAPAVFGRSPAPSPDGKTIGVLFTAPFQEAGEGIIRPIRFKHFMCFFAGDDGHFLSARALAWPDDSVDPALTPPVAGLPLRYQFLWSRDSLGVFVISRAHAVLVPVSPKSPVQRVNSVPARALPTVGGQVSPQGQFMYLEENPAAPNQRRLVIQNVAGWVPFEKVSLTGLAAIRYSVP